MIQSYKMSSDSSGTSGHLCDVPSDGHGIHHDGECGGRPAPPPVEGCHMGPL